MSHLSILENISKIFIPDKPKDSGDLGQGDERIASVIHFGRAYPDQYAVDVGWYFANVFGQPKLEAPASTLRQFANTAWVSAAIKTIIDEVSSLDWDVVPKPNYEETYDEEKLKKVISFFKFPNRNGENFSTLLKKLMKDILELDSGVIVKVFSKGSVEKYTAQKIKKYSYSKESREEKGEEIFQVKKFKDYIDKEFNGDGIHLNEIFAMDGASFLINPDPYGILPEDGAAYFQYSFLHPTQRPLSFTKREIVYFKMTPRTNSPYGFSPIQSLFAILESLNSAARFNRDYFVENAIPSGVMSLMGASKESLQKFKQEWDQNIRGKPHKLAMFNQEIKWTPMNMGNKDMEWLEGQKFYQRLVWALFGVTADELGFTETSNRSVGQSQSRVFVRRAIKPYVQLLEAKFTQEIISEFYEGDPEVEFKFDYIDQNELLLHREEEMKDLEHGVRTINEVRNERGLEPVPWGDEPFRAQAQQSPFSFQVSESKPQQQSNQAETQKPKEEEKPKEEKEEKQEIPPKTKKENLKFSSFEDYKQKVNLEIAEKMPNDSYEKFLLKYYSEIEDEITRLFKEEMMQKGYAEFAREIAKYFSVEGLNDRLFKFIKKVFADGVKRAEDELNVDIGVIETDYPTIEKYVKEEVEGYTFPDGKANWPGIKGLNNETQANVIKAIEAGVQGGESIPDIADRIQKEFTATKSRATMIARTESNRIMSNGKYQGYLKSGYDGEVVWFSRLDKDTSDVCEYLNEKSVPIGQDFQFPGTVKSKPWSGQFPPAHPNCRSTFYFKPTRRE